MLFKANRVMENLLDRGIDLNAPGGVELLTEVLRVELPGFIGWSYDHIIDELTVEAFVASDSEAAEVIQRLSVYGNVEVMREVF